jgi:putative nicotinate phosphoribosyltransferase
MRLSHADEVALVTDLYELTMAQAYVQAAKAHEMATFSLFVRRYPPHRGYFVAAGLADVVRYLEGWHFSPEAIDALRHTHLFADDLLDCLKRVRFTGEVRAIHEGRLFFVDEPVMLNHVHFQSVIATKAARYKAIESPDTYPVALNPQLHAVQARLEHEVAETEASKRPWRTPDASR